MPEGIFCNKRPVNTEEDLKALLSDTRGTKYYEEMLALEVDREKLWATIQKTFKSRMQTWLDVCARCGLCADSCFLYLVNDRGADPGAVLQDPFDPGRDRAPQGRRGQRVHAPRHGSGLVPVHLLQPLRHVLPPRHRHRHHDGLPARPALFPGVRALGAQDRRRHAPGLPGPDGRDHRGLGRDLRVDGRGTAGRLAGPGNPGGQGRRGHHVHV